MRYLMDGGQTNKIPGCPLEEMGILEMAQAADFSLADRTGQENASKSSSDRERFLPGFLEEHW